MRVFDFPPSDLMRPLYCRSADSRMRMQNALLLFFTIPEDENNRKFQRPNAIGVDERCELIRPSS